VAARELLSTLWLFYRKTIIKFLKNETEKIQKERQEDACAKNGAES
jgi:chloramphenicol O-acetyltransferase